MHPALLYTALAACAALLVAGIWADGRKPGSRLAWLRKLSLVMQLGAVAGAYLVLRPGRGDDPRVALAAAAAARSPMLLDIYSNW